jgi:hypothetical protein
MTTQETLRLLRAYESHNVLFMEPDGTFPNHEANPLLVEDSRNVAVPFRWVSSVGDIILLRFFPKRVSIKKTMPPPEAPPEDVEAIK